MKLRYYAPILSFAMVAFGCGGKMIDPSDRIHYDPVFISRVSLPPSDYDLVTHLKVKGENHSDDATALSMLADQARLAGCSAVIKVKSSRTRGARMLLVGAPAYYPQAEGDCVMLHDKLITARLPGEYF